MRPDLIESIAMLKLSDNPPICFPEGILEEPQQDCWWVGHSKSRFEKAFAWEMHKRQVPYFLPMVERLTISGGKKRRAMQPLFSGYVFFRGSGETRYEALLTDRLCQVIAVPQQDLLLRELRSLQIVLSQKAVLDLFPFAAVGRRCRVRGGPFEGAEGTVISRDQNKARFVLQVSILGQGAALEIDGDLLEPAEDDGQDPATSLTTRA